MAMAGGIRGAAAKPMADTASPLVVIVEDDEGVREALQDLLRSVGWTPSPTDRRAPSSPQPYRIDPAA